MKVTDELITCYKISWIFFWREIDLREKMNHPFYYPENDGVGSTTGDRRSLIDVIYSAINEGTLQQITSSRDQLT